MSLDWQEDANCTTTDPDAFFPETGANVGQLRKICGQRTVTAECLALGMQYHTGFFGGKTVVERRAMRERT